MRYFGEEKNQMLFYFSKNIVYLGEENRQFKEILQ